MERAAALKELGTGRRVPFASAVKILGDAPPLIAHALSTLRTDGSRVPDQSVRMMLLDPAKRSHRPPPSGWEGPLAERAQARSEHLAALACRLRRQAAEAGEG